MSFVLRLRARGLADVAVLRALETVPRHLFVPHLYADLAWRDIALPIACGQTMSEPFTLARVMEALRVAPGHRVLEVGAGSGYATAILARLGAEVVSFERYRTLATEASVRLRELGFANARVIHGDGLAPHEGFDLGTARAAAWRATPSATAAQVSLLPHVRPPSRPMKTRNAAKTIHTTGIRCRSVPMVERAWSRPLC